MGLDFNGLRTSTDIKIHQRLQSIEEDDHGSDVRIALTYHFFQYAFIIEKIVKMPL